MRREESKKSPSIREGNPGGALMLERLPSQGGLYKMPSINFDINEDELPLMEPTSSTSLQDKVS